MLPLLAAASAQVSDAKLSYDDVYVGTRNGDVVHSIGKQSRAGGARTRNRDDAAPARASVSAAGEVGRPAEAGHESAVDGL
jgi:hypothetical protein